jgi:tight adherence protein C
MGLTLATLILATCAALSLSLATMRRAGTAQQRLIRLADGGRAPDPAADGVGLLGEDAHPFLVRFVDFFAKSSLVSEAADRGRLQTRLIEAGYRRPSAVIVYMGTRVGLALALPLSFLVLTSTWGFPKLQLLGLLLLATGAGYVAPGVWVDRRRHRRQIAIEHSLPDALDLMVVCVQAGLGIVASLDRVVRDLARTHPILSAEFELAIYEIRAGKATTDALRALAARTGVSEIHALVAMLVQTERFGTGIADTLRIHADALRSRRMQRAEELANKAPLKMLFPTALIFFATLIVSLGPALAKILLFFAEKANRGGF